jgi:hypothetical protein
VGARSPVETGTFTVDGTLPSPTNVAAVEHRRNDVLSSNGVIHIVTK